jgi:nitroreductase
MKIIEAITQRKSTRAFQNKLVSREKIVSILKAARHAPSGANTQPWQVAVVTGDKKQELSQTLEAAFDEQGVGAMDYLYYPDKWKEPYKKRRVSCGAQLYSALDIKRRDRDKRIEQWVANYRAFDAPVVLFFFMDSQMETGSFLDCGMFIQSVMLAALEEGLATCPQAALGQYPEVIKGALGYNQDTILICGMALGYEDKDAPVNNYRTPREQVEKFTRFFE